MKNFSSALEALKHKLGASSIISLARVNNFNNIVFNTQKNRRQRTREKRADGLGGQIPTSGPACPNGSARRVPRRRPHALYAAYAQGGFPAGHTAGPAPGPGGRWSGAEPYGRWPQPCSPLGSLGSRTSRSPGTRTGTTLSVFPNLGSADLAGALPDHREERLERTARGPPARPSSPSLLSPGS